MNDHNLAARMTTTSVTAQAAARIARTPKMTRCIHEIVKRLDDGDGATVDSTPASFFHAPEQTFKMRDASDILKIQQKPSKVTHFVTDVLRTPEFKISDALRTRWLS